MQGETVGKDKFRKELNINSKHSPGGTQSKHGMETITFLNMQIKRGQRLGHLPMPNNCDLFTAMDMENGQLYHLSQWTMDEIQDVSFVNKEISFIEQELEVLCKRKHPNLLHYINLQSAMITETKQIVNLLTDFISGPSCNALYISKGIPVDIAMLRRIAKDVLSALDFLHQNDIVHKNVCASSVYINNQGDIQLSNYSVYQRLADLVTHSTSTNQYSKETDIFKFGIFILSLTLGNCVDENEIAIPENIAVDLRDFIDKCFLTEENRYTAMQLLEHSFLEVQSFEDNINTHKSRFRIEFEVLEKIGTGGFGEVFKVRNKLDDVVYAIKRIKLTSGNKADNENILREVRILSRLNHEYVVRYYNSWIENTTNDNEDNYVSNTEFDFGNTTYTEETITMENSNKYDSKINEDEGSEIQTLYIQMECCDKSTLKTAIDSGLYLDKKRVWRLFREIIEGLSYIHQQEMIHRDLKPANIFLDADDHVKIGDFGLATTIDTHIGEKIYQRKDGDPYSLTGNIGTPSYAAPELKTDMERTKTTYNQKVDIYSLGILFFEMCYKPCTTHCEHASNILKLRTKSITFPNDLACAKQKQILKMLLDHVPDNRPTTQKLLELEYIPPLVAEDRKVREMIRYALENPEQEVYKYTIDKCMKQPQSPSQDHSSDNYMSLPFSKRNSAVFNYARDMIVDVFKRHGAHELPMPQLMCNNNDNDIETNIKLMTNSGGVVTIPYDLRRPFAKYVILNGITSLRRYSVDRVYREKLDSGFIPTDYYECAFDIVTPSPFIENQQKWKIRIQGNLMANFEVISILNDIANAIPSYQDKNLYIRLNHMTLLEAILMFCGIKDIHHKDIFGMLVNALMEGKVTKTKVEEYLLKIGIPKNNVIILFRFLYGELLEDKLYKLMLRLFARRKYFEPAKLARHAWRDIKFLFETAKSSGVNIKIVIEPLLVSKAPEYSGMICQLVCGREEHVSLHKGVLATGGRYDGLLNYYQTKLLPSRKTPIQSAVGVSIFLDRLVQTFIKYDFNTIECTKLDAIVAGFDNTTLVTTEVCKIMRGLRNAGLKVTNVPATNLKEISQQGDRLKVQYVIIYEEGRAKARVHCCNNEVRFEWFEVSELVENFQRLVESNSTKSTKSSVKVINIDESSGNDTNKIVMRQQTRVPVINYIVSYP